MRAPDSSAHRHTGRRYRAPEPSPLLGRDQECLAIDELIARVRDGLSGVLVLSGEAGIGKTRLLGYAAKSAADLQVAAVVGVETESQLAYAALHRLLLPLLDRLDRLPGPQLEALGSAFGLVAGPPADRFLAGLATLTLLSEVVRDGPLMCLVDDAQWLDRESLEALAFVGRRLHADGIGLVLCARDGHPAASPLDGLPAVRLTGLSDADAARLLSSMRVAPYASAAESPGRPAPSPVVLRTASVTSLIIAETGGNPLALIEFAGGLTDNALPAAPVPRLGPRLEAHFQRQVDALPDSTKSLLLVLSVARSDDPAVLWRAAAALGLPAHALDAAVANGILAVDRHPVFRHPLIRSAVHSGALPAELRRVHQALAEATDREAAPDRRAWHLAEAVVGLDEELAAELERVADRARGRGGYAAQAAFLLRAAELTPEPQVRAERYFAAAQAHLFIGEAAVVQPMLDQAESGPSTPVTRATAQRLRATLEWFDGRIQAAPTILMAAARDVIAYDEPLARDMVFEALSAGMMTREHTAGMTLEDLARQALAMPWDRSRPSAVSDVLIDAYCTRIAEGYAPAMPKLRAAVETLRTTELVDTAVPLAVLGLIGAEDLWDDDAHRAVVGRFAAASREQGAVHALATVLNTVAVNEIWAGRLSGAEACFDEADEIFGSVVNMPFGASHRVELRAWQGREADLRTGAKSAIGVWGDQLGYAVMACHAHYALTIWALGAGRYQEALTWARLGFENDVPGQGNRLLPDVVEAAVRAGDPATASAALARLAARAPLSSTPWALGVLARSRALMADDDEAEGLYEEALKQLGTTTLATELARAHLLYGEWLRRRQRRTEARTQLRTAYEMFIDIGASGFAERARVELLATGEHARKRSAQADYDLTAHEKQVAALAAGGSTNTEIATRLFITASTVEYHLNKVFRKLGITSRRQLAAVLGAP
ncbi:DNA-binding CsgD family transcriptional regulator [Streptacidiphilus sp. MAP12-16]|uniref:helix-turn-helix transcriptional regulator n=1 Tax=Streptacidiphilus sp. MAP12-16 TaxID=3156300 RepID=UPI003515370C